MLVLLVVGQRPETLVLGVEVVAVAAVQPLAHHVIMGKVS